MGSAVADACLDTIFRNARTFSYWLPKPVEDSLLRQIYDLAKWGPTSANTAPMRLLFVKSHEAKIRLKPALMPGNVEKTMSAPVCVIVASDSKFHEQIPKLWPQNPQMGAMFSKPGSEQLAHTHALRNGSLQGAYMIIAARALGLDCGPMSGFDNAMVDAEFFPDGQWKSNFLLNLGYGDSSKLHPRNPRLEFDEACKTV